MASRAAVQHCNRVTVAAVTAASAASSMVSSSAAAAGRRPRRQVSSLACCLLAAGVVLLRLAGAGWGVNWVGPRAAFAPATVSSRCPLRGRGRGLTARPAGDNLFDRFVRVAKSNVNKVLQGIEDPEKLLDQAVDEMQQDLISVRQSYAEVLATQRRLMSQKEQQDSTAAEWYRRAELAVEKGEDALAKEALTRRQAAVEKGNALNDQIAGMTANVEKLFDSVKMLEEKIQSAKEEKETLVARARTAKTTSQVNEMLSDVGTSSAAQAFDRMKEKVETLETRAEVSEGMLPGLTAGSSIDDKFKALESGSAVDDELARLKGSKALPAAADPLDDELAAMRKKLKDSKGGQ